MDSENSSDGELNARSGGYASSDEERSDNHDTDRRKVPRSPPDSPPDSPGQGSHQNSQSSGSPSNRLSPPSSPVRRSMSKSPDQGRPSRRTPSGSPGSPGSPAGRSQSGSSGRSPSGSPPCSPSRRSQSGSPSRRSPSRSPPKHSVCRSPEKQTDSPNKSSADDLHPARRTPSSHGSPGESRNSDRESYSRRTHGKKSKRRNEGDGNASDGSDDGRSNISSSSSFGDGPGSRVDRKGPVRLENGDQKERGKFEPHKAEDLSDVSDLDGSMDSLSDDEGSRKKKMKDEPKKSPSPVRTTHSSSLRKDIVSHSDEMEQLDFEAEEPQAKEDKEDGECAEAPQVVLTETPSAKSAANEADDGEVNNDEVEEGEITDEDENRPEETEPRPICRFYNRGQCTWGSSCRFLHPGVTDKGNYTMFDMVRPLVPTNGPPMYGPISDYRAPLERTMLPPSGPAYPSRKEEAPAVESAWERGLRTAKEMMRKASKRKETDMDFEEKKMNLSLGQDELDKENDYYTRPASPALEEEMDRWSAEGKHHRMVVSDRFDAVDAYYGQYHRDGRERWGGRGHYDDPREAYGREHMFDSRHPGSHHDSTMAYRAHMHGSTHHEAGYYPDKYERKKKSHTVREVIVQHSRKPSYKDEKSSSGPHRGRGDEWADPWMRSKSPNARKPRPTRRQSYSSGSSYSSSRSTSRSSYSSFISRSGSRSRSRSRSKSRSASGSRSRSPRHPSQSLRRPGAGPGANTGAGANAGTGRGNRDRERDRERERERDRGSPSQRGQRRGAPDSRPRGSRVEPAEADKRSAQASRKPRPPSPATARKSGPNSGPGRVGKIRHSKSSRSSSSDSSGSSSDSSETSLSSSSSSRDPTPPPKPKTKIQMDERLMAQSTKVKAMDALKLSGQKQQIKLTLKTQGSSAAGTPDERRSAVVAGKKRTAETPPPESPNKASTIAKPPAKKTTSRREELLKQLKAVEDAIARKRSKIT